MAMTDLKAPKGTTLTAAMLDAMVAEGLTAAQIAAIVKAALPEAPETKPRGRKGAELALAADTSPRQALERVLEPARAAAIVDHRRRLRAPLTVHAAELLAGKFAQTPDPNDAADLMIERGWKGFNPAWLAPAKPAAAPCGKTALQQLNDHVRGDR